MLKTILSVTGKPGLFKLISNAKNIVIVESLTDKRKLPIYARDKVVALGDIAMYTDEGEVPLQNVLIAIKEKESGKTASVLPTAQPDELKAYLSEALPTYDRERIHASDIKKLISWYNTLIAADIDFSIKEEEAAAETSDAAVEPAVAEKAKKPKAAKTTTPKPAATNKKVKTEAAAKTEKRIRSKKG
ncbi:MAG: DUF5606 domain-containing protein [Prevotella sp.]|jgi:hypothetical protein|nr:DUF5606 domain-containing protein [Prevotella sp.]